MKWTEQLMQSALTARRNLFDFTAYACVPNVTYGLGYSLNHECDLLCMSKAGVLHEVEIKVSKADMRADKRKHYDHWCPLVSFVWFAVPLGLEECALQEVDNRFGIVVVADVGNHFSTRVVRRPKHNPIAVKPTPEQREKLLRLGVMRMWSRRQSTGYQQEAKPETLAI